VTPLFQLSRRGLLSLATRIAMADGVRDAGDFVPARIASFTFQPPLLRISLGQRVLWRNDDDVPHSVIHAAHPHLFRSRVLFPGDQFAHQFNQPGAFPYFCGIHPHMRATIHVS
jgi:plastocyanin